MSDVRPVLIGPANALEMTGAPWHFWRRHAAELGLEIVTLGSKRFIRAADLDAVMQRRATPAVAATEMDELAEMRARIARAG